jgi:hypothetical protein
VIGDEVQEVTSSGLAVVHVGEKVRSRRESAASFAVVEDESGVHFHFPVEIEVRSADPAPDPEAHVRSALDRLADHLGG